MFKWSGLPSDGCSTWASVVLVCGVGCTLVWAPSVLSGSPISVSSKATGV